MGLIADFHWPSIAGLFAFLDLFIVAITLLAVLTIKREPTSALAWALVVIFLPVIGMVLFVTFGYQNVNRPLSRKRQHSRDFRSRLTPALITTPETDQGLAVLAERLGGSPLTLGNHIEFYHEGNAAFEAMLDAIRSAKHHIHLEFFITRGDDSGRTLMHVLAERAKAGVQVRFLYDAMGSWSLGYSVLKILTEAGGRAVPFLTLMNPLRRRMQINLRNHRKILVVDGKVGFTGGMNIGDEYLGKVPRFGYWRDTFLKIEGPAVVGLQRVFAEDWDFAADEEIEGIDFYRVPPAMGDHPVQIAWSGPDQETKAIREVYFAAIMRAQKRVWIATPYLVPDAALTDALALAARSNRDVRILVPFRPDKWIPLLASRYIWGDLLHAGVKIFQYSKGFMHSKMILIDDNWASVGSVNFDNRSFQLNFEISAFIESTSVVAGLDETLRRDFANSLQVDPQAFAHRPFISKMAENVARLASPIL